MSKTDQRTLITFLHCRNSVDCCSRAQSMNRKLWAHQRRASKRSFHGKMTNFPGRKPNRGFHSPFFQAPRRSRLGQRGISPKHSCRLSISGRSTSSQSSAPCAVPGRTLPAKRGRRLFHGFRLRWRARLIRLRPSRSRLGSVPRRSAGILKLSDSAPSGKFG